ncbi:MAG: N-methyl-L-tryptophan oxidase [Longimicrobiales bacterium]
MVRDRESASFDVIVVGLGGMGSAAAYHLARRGLSVLGLERFTVPHDFGSSHGESRIIRLAYFEHPDYVPLLRRSYELWRSLQSEAGESLLVATGSLDASGVGQGVFDESLESCRVHGIDHEVLTAAEVSTRFPGVRLPSDAMAVFQADGGFLRPDRCVVAHVEGAKRAGAVVQTGERVLGIDEVGDGVEVTTDQGRYRAGRVVVTAGPWASELIGASELLSVERQVLLWVAPLKPEDYVPECFPVFNIRGDLGHYYGFPLTGPSGVKLGKYHHLEEVVDPDTVDRETHPEDEAAMRAFLAAVLPGANGEQAGMKTCLFTNTPDEHFIVGPLPGASRVIVGAGFSGHGFKFASAIGETLSDLACDQAPSAEIRFLSMDRFAS